MRNSLSSIFFFLILASYYSTAFSKTKNHQQFKKISLNSSINYLSQNLDLFDHKTLYCSCDIIEKTVNIKSCGYSVQRDIKQAMTLAWTNVVPAVVFGRNFLEWSHGTEQCIENGRQYKGRRCAEKNPEFVKIESDLYNLFPEIAELKELRSSYAMATLINSVRDFGECRVKLAEQKFQPQEESRGVVARTYMNLNHRYPDRGIVSVKNKKLFEVWDKKYPVTATECRRWKALEAANGYKHLFAYRCKF